MTYFETDSLQKLLKDFYNLTDIKTCLYDLDGNELGFYPKRLSGFCELLRQDPEMDERCRDCDKHGFATCRRTRSQYAYTCHAGLMECISPITLDNRIIGFIMIGQIRKSNESAPCGFSPALMQAYDSLPTISEQKLRSAFHVLDACASYELFKGLINAVDGHIETKIAQYVTENLHAPLSVAELRSAFHLSHYEIYNICKQYFGCTPAEYIKQCRLKHACTLLTTTSLPVNRIAVLSGIPDYNYFSKIFKSAFGVSPRQYRASGKVTQQ